MMTRVDIGSWSISRYALARIFHHTVLALGALLFLVIVVLQWEGGLLANLSRMLYVAFCLYTMIHATRLALFRMLAGIKDLKSYWIEGVFFFLALGALVGVCVALYADYFGLLIRVSAASVVLIGMHSMGTEYLKLAQACRDLEKQR